MKDTFTALQKNRSSLLYSETLRLNIPGRSRTDTTGVERHLVAICKFTHTRSTPQQMLLTLKGISTWEQKTWSNPEAGKDRLQRTVWRKLTRATRKTLGTPKGGGVARCMFMGVWKKGGDSIPRTMLAIAEARKIPHHFVLAKPRQATEKMQENIAKCFLLLHRLGSLRPLGNGKPKIVDDMHQSLINRSRETA